MAQVICRLPNAASIIHGIKGAVSFVEHKFGKISEEIDDEVAQVFTSIQGFELAPVSTSTKKAEKVEKVEKVEKTDNKDAPPGGSSDADDKGASDQKGSGEEAGASKTSKSIE